MGVSSEGRAVNASMLAGLMSAVYMLGCGSVEPGTDASIDSASDTPVADAEAGTDGPTQYLCPGAKTRPVCENLACSWWYACNSDAGFCADPTVPSCPSSKCAGNEKCVAFEGKLQASSACGTYYLCVDCNPNAPYPYDCADAGP